MPTQFSRLIIAVVLVMLCFSIASAQQAVIGPRDTLKITVMGEAEQSKQVIVDDDGKISLPLAKDIVVSGLTTSAAADTITQSLKSYLKNPVVTVEMVAHAQKNVTIAGQIKTSGVYPIDRGTRLMQAVGLAGGFLPTADKSKITVTRRGTETPLICNMEAFLAGNAESANVELQDGDVISIPEANPTLGTVYVFGAVKTPGQAISIRDGMKVSQAISAAGGILPDQADPSRATVKRDGQKDVVQVDLLKALSGDQTADLVLNPGDTITVPAMEQYGTYKILGAVGNSGEFPIKGKMTITSALALAAVRQDAKMSEVRLNRTSTSTSPQAMKIDVKKISEGRSEDVALQPGDSIYVPAQGQREGLSRWLAVGVSVIGILLK